MGCIKRKKDRLSAAIGWRLDYCQRCIKWHFRNLRYGRSMGKIKDQLCAVIRMVVLVASMGKLDYDCRSGETKPKH
jgi:hypothetical protein